MQDPGTEAQQEFMRQAADGTPAAVRRIQEFSDDYLGITQELWKFIVCGQGTPGAAPQVLKEKFERMYLPSFGPTLAQQGSHERLMATTLRWQRASAQVSAKLQAVAADAVEKLVAALGGPDATGPPVTSLRQLHDLWVECGERAYAAAAHSENFAAAQAELLAAMVEMRFEQRRQIEEWARAFNLPTRAEIDSIHERLHALRRMQRKDFEP